LQSLGRLATHWMNVLVVALLIVSTLGLVSPLQTNAQDDGTVATPGIEVDVPDEPPVELQPTEDTGTGDVEAESTQAPDPVDDPTAEPTATPQAMLTYSQNANATCMPASGLADAVIDAGASLDYICSFATDLHAENVPLDGIDLSWSASASVDDGWDVQLATDSIDSGAWSESGHNRADLETHAYDQSVLNNSASGDDPAVNIVTGTVTLSFKLRLSRPACASDAPTVTLALSSVASVPDNNQAIVTQDGDPLPPVELHPQLAPITYVPPTISIVDFAIAPVEFSLSDQTTEGTLTIQVENAAMQCQNSVVSVSVQAFTGTDLQDTVTLQSTGDLFDAPAEGYVAVPPGEDISLVSLVNVSVVQAGAAAGSYTQTMGFELTIPGQLSAGAFDAQASAVVEPGSP
jgi:hypothetical protein